MSFDKSGMRYSFEKVHGEPEPKFQVRLNGQFIMYVPEKNPDLVDQELENLGFSSRKEVFDETVQESLRSLNLH